MKKTNKYRLKIIRLEEKMNKYKRMYSNTNKTWKEIVECNRNIKS